MPDAIVPTRRQDADGEDDLMRTAACARAEIYLRAVGASPGWSGAASGYCTDFASASRRRFAMPASSLRAKPGHLVDDAGELALAEHDELHVGLGDDGRVAGRLVEERELAERVAGAERRRSCGPGG